MLFLERLAEQRIREAVERGDLDNLPGAGRPLPEEEGLELVAPDLRMAYRLLKNAGYVPEAVLLRREIADVRQLLGRCQVAEAPQLTRRLRLLLLRLGETGGTSPLLEDSYLCRLGEKLAES